jgi:hypothetical protein
MARKPPVNQSATHSAHCRLDCESVGAFAALRNYPAAANLRCDRDSPTFCRNRVLRRWSIIASMIWPAIAVARRPIPFRRVGKRISTHRQYACASGQLTPATGRFPEVSRRASCRCSGGATGTNSSEKFSSPAHESTGLVSYNYLNSPRPDQRSASKVMTCFYRLKTARCLTSVPLKQGDARRRAKYIVDFAALPRL